MGAARARPLWPGWDRLIGEWREQCTRREPTAGLSARARFAIERVLTPILSQSDPAAWEAARHTAARLARLNVPVDEITAAVGLFCGLAGEWRRRERNRRARAELERGIERCQPLSLAVAQAYAEERSRAREALLAVLDAELSAHGLDPLLQRLLERTAAVFPLCWGAVLLADAPAGRLRPRAWYGVGPELARADVGGRFFVRVARAGEPACLLDAASETGAVPAYFRDLHIRSVWAAPLGGVAAPGAPPVLGVLAIAFDRVCEFLPQERALLAALAQRSSLAIERARLVESLACERQKVLDLSRRLLHAQEEERRRISRDLHDETGQALLALRLYLEMGMRSQSSVQASAWVQRGIRLVDTTVEGLRRIMAQLSPPGLDQLGLERSLRGELRRQSQVHGWRTRFRCDLGPAAPPRPLEVLVFRLLQEGISNIARHARATAVRLELTAAGGNMDIVLEDNGVGFRPMAEPAANGSHLGLPGMRERLRLAGGSLHLASAPGRGVRLRMRIPMHPAGGEHPNHVTAVPALPALSGMQAARGGKHVVAR